MGLLPLPGIRQFHSIKSVRPHVVEAKKTSNYAEALLHSFVLGTGVTTDISSVQQKISLQGPLTECNLTYGQWVCVEYGSLKKKHFIGQVIDDQEDEIQVRQFTAHPV